MLAGVLLWCLENFDAWRCLAISDKGDHVLELRKHIEDVARASGLVDDTPEQLFEFRTSPGAGRIVHKATGSMIDFFNTSPTAGQSSSADVVLIDEAGLINESMRELWESLFQSMATRNGLFVGCGVLSRSPMFHEMKERAKESQRVEFHYYGAVEDDEILDESTWKKANPGLGERGCAKSLEYMKGASERASKSPLAESEFRVFDLNTPIEPSAQLLCSLSDWKGCLVDELPLRKNGAFCGWDLGASRSMSAFAAYWPASGRVEFWCGFPAEPGLDARGKGDGVGQLYALAQRAGELALYDGKNIDAAAFIGDVVDDLQGQILMVGADRFRQAEAEQALQNAKLHLRMAWRGTGAGSRADGSYDIRATDRAITGRKLKIKPHLIAAEAIRPSRLRFDTAGNPALSKEKRDSRIDLLSALVMACGLAEKHGATRQRRPLRAEAV